MFQGCGTALVTPFRSDLSLDEEALRRLVRRQIEAGHPLPRPLRHHGREPDALPRGAAPGGRDHPRGGQGQGARARRRGRQRHPRGGRDGPRATRPWASTASSRSPPTTTSRRRRACSSTTARSPAPPACRSSSTTCRAAPARTSRPTCSPAWPRSRPWSGSRRPRATSPRCRRSSRRCPRTSWCSRATTR